MKTCCVVVVGHVDHGKTSLVHALTGIETDRLPEEKTRGLSITPGFAHCAYPSGTIDFVDAPGHADFVQAMIWGATGAQAALIVISITEGIGAQTLEHLRIAELLGIRRAVIAVTKADLLTAAEMAERLIAIRAALSQTAFATAQLVMCSARSGDGIETLNSALEDLISEAPMPAPALHSFLPIDRVFSLPGRGTIVTGTLLGRKLTVDDSIELQPLSRHVTMRALQSRGVERQCIHVGERMAANLRGVKVDEIQRGSVLCATGAAAPTHCVDVRLNVLHGSSKGLKHMQDVRVLFGTSNEVAQVRLFKDDDPSNNFAQLRFKKPVVCFAGQMAILRSLSPPDTIGGAVILDPQAALTRPSDGRRLNVLKAADQGDIRGLADALSKLGGGSVDLSNVARLARLTPEDTRKALGPNFVALNGSVIASIETINIAKVAVLKELAAYHHRFPLRSVAPGDSLGRLALSSPLLQHVEAALSADKQIRRRDNMLALWDHNPLVQLSAAQQKTMADIEDDYRKKGLSMTSPKELLQTDEYADLLQLLLDRGALIALRNVALKQTLVFHRDTVTAAAETLATAFPPPQSFTTSQARNALATSRRIIVPLLEHFDSVGVTLRSEDARQMATNSVSH